MGCHDGFCLCQDRVCLLRDQAGPGLNADADGTGIIGRHQLCLHAACQEHSGHDNADRGQHDDGFMF